jgi:hypothetical protein
MLDILVDKLLEQKIMCLRAINIRVFGRLKQRTEEWRSRYKIRRGSSAQIISGSYILIRAKTKKRCRGYKEGVRSRKWNEPRWIASLNGDCEHFYYKVVLM